MSFCEDDCHDQPPHILVVEDNVLIQKYSENVLTALGCKVTTVNDGVSALAGDLMCYDLVLLDIGLPGMSGIDVCRTIRASYPNFSVPIVAYTACGTILEPECRAAGASDFKVKPLSVEDFAALLKFHLGWEKK